jgi:hypothetical protein
MAYGNGGSYGEVTAAQCNTNAAVPVAPRPTMVSEQVSRLDKLVDALHGQLSELEARLSPVLMPEGPGTVGNKDQPGPMPVALASRIGAHGDAVTGACQRIQSLLGRLEL